MRSRYTNALAASKNPKKHEQSAAQNKAHERTCGGVLVVVLGRLVCSIKVRIIERQATELSEARARRLRIGHLAHVPAQGVQQLRVWNNVCVCVSVTIMTQAGEGRRYHQRSCRQSCARAARHRRPWRRRQ